MISHKSQPTAVSKIIVNVLIVFCIGVNLQITLAQAPPGTITTPTTPVNNSPTLDPAVPQDTAPTTTKRDNFNNTAARITADAALGDEVALLPGPNVNFNDLLRIIITWSASLAASVAIFIFILRSFLAIQGTEDSRNNLKNAVIKILIGLTLIFFSYQIISLLMGILWAV